MRLPGFIHKKGEPFQTCILSCNADAPYTVAEIVSGLGLTALICAPAPRLKTKEPTPERSSVEITNFSEGSRNNKLTSLAGTMRRRGMGFASINAALQQENLTRCDPPLDEDEVMSIAKSISHYDPDDGSSQPEYTRADLAAMIDSTADFDELTGRIATLIATSNLREAERELLHKQLAKKSKISIDSLRRDAKSFQQGNVTVNSEHLHAARAVIREYGEGDLLHANGYLWGWRGIGVWQRIDDRETKQVIHSVAANKELTANIVGSVLDMVKTESHRAGHRFDQNTNSINCANGELIFQNDIWNLVPHDREHYCTTMIPIAYDASAQAPRFCSFLEEIFEGDPDKDDKIKVVLEALGYTLIPSCHLEKFFMLIGVGANGKSVLLNIVAALVGREHACAVQPSQFENRFQRGHLQGRLANIITEIAEGAEMADAQLKSLVSGEMTTAEHKHKDPFDFVPYAKHWFGTNHLPHTRDFSDALFRRAIILTFNNKFVGEKCDVHLAEALRSELPGILNLALAGLKRLIENNAFTECGSSADIARQWRMEADQVAQFVGDDCDTGPKCRATSSELYLYYLNWANSAGVRRTLNRNNFTNRLTRLGFVPVRGAGGIRMIQGVQARGHKRSER
jgi:P4 family phage/plasmid primase-like protien